MSRYRIIPRWHNDDTAGASMECTECIESERTINGRTYVSHPTLADTHNQPDEVFVLDYLNQVAAEHDASHHSGA
jgi:hypothetical protein